MCVFGRNRPSSFELYRISLTSISIFESHTCSPKNTEAPSGLVLVPESSSNNNDGSSGSSPTDHDHNPSQYGLTFDATFASTTENTSLMHLETLEARLSTAQAALAKEAIRTAYLALAEFHRLRGDLRESLRRVLRSRDFCTNTRQTGQVCLMVIELGVDMRNYAQVRDYVTKAEQGRLSASCICCSMPSNNINRWSRC